MLLSKLFPALPVLALLAGHVAAQTATSSPATIILGENSVLGYFDNGNGGLLSAQGPYGLSQTATVQSLSFWVEQAAGELVLGLYGAGPSNDCRGGALVAATAVFTPVQGWNTQPVLTQAQLPVGYYCLAYLPSDNNLSFRKGVSSGVSEIYNSWAFTMGLPATFLANPCCGSQSHWSFYATLAPPTLNISFNPPNPTVPADAAPGTVIATIQVSWSNGAPFTGTVAFGPPNGSDGGIFAIDGNLNVIVATNGPGLLGDANTTQNITVVATQ